MNIICLVKFVPDTEKFEYDYKTDKINREASHLILNPDDKNAVAFAMKQKKQDPSNTVEIITMGPSKLEEEMKDFIRLGADQATLISDRRFSGSDSLATSRILASYLKNQEFDFILTGTHTLDGGTGHVAPQIAEFLGLDQLSNIIAIKEVNKDFSRVEALLDEKYYQVKLQNPSVLSVTHQMNLRLGFVRYENIGKNVDTQFKMISNESLRFSVEEIGGKGSPTKVKKNTLVKRKKVDQRIVSVNDQGIDEVIQFLTGKGYL